MSASRFRLRLAGWYAVAFLVGLGTLSLVMYQYLVRDSDARVGRELRDSQTELARAIKREWDEDPGDWTEAVQAALAEWPAGRFSFVVLDAAGRRLGTTGDPAVPAHLTPSVLATTPPGRRRDIPYDGEGDLRILVGRVAAEDGPTVVAALPLAALMEERESLALWMLVSAGPALLLALLGGYFLSRLALRPVQALGAQIDRISPALDERLRLHHPPDELDRLAGQFNALLDRLEAQRQRNRRFLQQAAHQLRTPLTLVLGESALELQPEIDSRNHAAAMQRVHTAAEQMRRRVNDLFLLAEMESGDRPPLREAVDLDGLVFETLDLFRGRAHALRRTLEFGTVDRTTVTGDSSLLREAVTEMLENACRHGDPASPVGVDVLDLEGEVQIRVSNGHPLHPAVAGASHPSLDPASPGGRGLGLSILRWIAEAHGGRFEFRDTPSQVEAMLTVPSRPFVQADRGIS